MTDEKKFDPFKPQQPRIPGVSAGAPQEKPALREPPSDDAAVEKISAPRMPWVPLAAASVLILILGALLLAHLTSRGQDQTGSSSSSAAAAAAASRPAEDLPVGPGYVARADKLENAWSSARFLFHNSLTDETAPAMVVRLPGGDYWGFSLREPFGTCDLQYVTDLDSLRVNFNFRADHPMVVDPCNHSVFDLMRYGTTPSGSVVRGEIEQGGAIRPPIAIEIRREGNEIIAVRME